MLELRDVVCRYGEVTVLKGISLQVGQGQLVTLIGTNGAGKSTTLKTISGLLKPASGSIVFEGQDITNASPRRILELGIAHCPEGRRVFPFMTVDENLEMGCFLRSDRQRIKEDLERIFDQFPKLAERRQQAAGTLSGGERQMLAVGRALMGKPQLLMLDEPSLGLAPLIVKEIFHIISALRQTGVATLLIEQNARAALQISDYGYVLETGEVALEGKAEELQHNPQVIETYLGLAKKAV